jgi:DNA sulfur modification protein DndD
MLIDKIVLNNYRIYEGTTTIEFDYDFDRNINIISGNNGYGKTSFLTSLIWCLYGKAMSEVDEKYKKEIYESGGYRKYCEKTINRNFHSQNTLNNHPEENIFSVTMLLSKIFIPSLPCDSIQIKRSYNIDNGNENLEILLDKRINELTRELGPEIFINDFILPREIAKFFFFDAEKIVSLAEMRSLEEKRQLSRAYSEVLGIKKYEDLKNNLENIRLKLRKGANMNKDQQRLKEFNTSIATNEKLQHFYENKITELKEVLAKKKSDSDNYQERLIREGSTITLEELKDLQELKQSAVEENKLLKVKVSELLDFAPFAIASGKLKEVYAQMTKEIEIHDSKVSQGFLQKKLNNIREQIADQKGINISQEQEAALFKILEDHLLNDIDLNSFKNLLNFNTEEANNFTAVIENLKQSYGKRLKEVTNTLKINQSTFSIVNNKLRNAETKENDLIIQEIRKEKTKLEKEITSLEDELIKVQASLFNVNSERATHRKLSSELTRKVEVEETDRLKDLHASRLIEELTVFAKKLKVQKKAALEGKILDALKKLMHKDDFITRVDVIVEHDYIDIELFDSYDNQINKEGLSKGEQQLYATALLKALVDESNFRFPLFVDSPLQKFDKKHAYNIITEFYPSISEQVVLFPLLEKELSNEEYSWLLKKVNKVFLIEHTGQNSSEIKEIKPDLLFESSPSLI